jgi:DNA ligase-1
MGVPKGFKPMLASPADLDKLRYPVWVSPKLDGIRAIASNGKLYSRSLKLIPNNELQANALLDRLDLLDGELISGSQVAPEVFQVTTSDVMTADKPVPNVRFYVFDYIDSRPFEKRLADLSKFHSFFVRSVTQKLVENKEDLFELEEDYIRFGFEGIMIRDPQGLYKYGRSTVKEQYLLKLKRFEDDDGVIVGFEEKEHNENVLERDNLGHAKRSTKQSGKRKAGTLGALILECENWPDRVRIGTGLSDGLRHAIWKDRRAYLGKIVSFRFQRTGTKHLPRIPSFKGFRDKRDMG